MNRKHYHPDTTQPAMLIPNIVSIVVLFTGLILFSALAYLFRSFFSLVKSVFQRRPILPVT